MFERFTAWGREVIVMAQDEARGLKHASLGPEHLLLGLLRFRSGLGASVLERLGVSLEDARRAVAAAFPPGDRAPAGQIPFTPRARQVLEQALREAMSLGHDYIGTEHLLLAVARERDGVVGTIIESEHQLREEVMRALDAGEGGAGAEGVVPAGTPSGHHRAGGAAEAVARFSSPWDPAVHANLLLGILAAGGPVADLLRERGVTDSELRSAFLSGD